MHWSGLGSLIVWITSSGKFLDYILICFERKNWAFCWHLKARYVHGPTAHRQVDKSCGDLKTTSTLYWLGCHICRFFCFAHLAAASKVPSTSGGTSSSESSSYLPETLLPGAPIFPVWSIKSFKKPYCWGPTCFKISGSKSLISFASELPVTTKRFSRTENWTTHRKKNVLIDNVHTTIRSYCFDSVTLVCILYSTIFTFNRKERAEVWSRDCRLSGKEMI